MPVIPATWEAKVGGSLEPGRLRLHWAMIVPLCSSLGNRVRHCLQKREKDSSRADACPLNCRPSIMYVNTGQGLSHHKQFLFHVSTYYCKAVDGKAIPALISYSDFNLQVHGENLFGAEYQLQICIPTKLRGLQVVAVKKLTRTQVFKGSSLSQSHLFPQRLQSLKYKN